MSRAWESRVRQQSAVWAHRFGFDTQAYLWRRACCRQPQGQHRQELEERHLTCRPISLELSASAPRVRRPQQPIAAAHAVVIRRASLSTAPPRPLDKGKKYYGRKWSRRTRPIDAHPRAAPVDLFVFGLRLCPRHICCRRSLRLGNLLRRAECLPCPVTFPWRRSPRWKLGVGTPCGGRSAAHGHHSHDAGVSPPHHPGLRSRGGVAAMPDGAKPVAKLAALWCTLFVVLLRESQQLAVRAPAQRLLRANG